MKSPKKILTIIIPAYREPYLQRTIDSLLENSKLGDQLEIIAVFDGYIPEIPIKPDPRVIVINLSKNLGMRGAINAGIVASRGEFIMKSDAHCLFGAGFDKIMIKDCKQNWLMIPRRYSINEKNDIWQVDKTGFIRDYHQLTFPVKTERYGTILSSNDWLQRSEDRKAHQYDIDDTMTFQGSCWLANKRYFMKQVGLLDDSKDTYGPWSDDYNEIGLKYWLGGGEVKVNKKTYYAHLSKRLHHYQKGLFANNYKLAGNAVNGHTWSTKHWLNNEEPGMIHPFSWLVEKFWPVPTWPEDRNLWVFHYE